MDHARASRDIAYFAREAVPEYVCDEVPDFHRVVFESLVDPENKRVCVVAPRGFAKSTISQIAILHSIAYCPKGQRRYILAVSESQPQSTDYLDNVKNIIMDGERFPDLFPFVKPGDVWGAERIITSTNVKVEALGTRQRVRGRNFRGKRPTMIFLDDFESETNSGTQEDRNRVRKWIRAALIPALAPGGRLVVCGTIIHEDAYLQRLMDPRVKEFKKFFFRARRNDGDPHRKVYDKNGMLWGSPHKTQDGVSVAFDKEWWDDTRERYRLDGALDTFHQEYQNDVRPGDPTFDKFPFYEQYRLNGGVTEILPEGADPDDSEDWVPVTTFMGVDPSTREHSKADFCVLMPIGVDADRNIYQLPYVRRRMGRDVKTIADEIFRLHDLYRFRTVGIETIGAQVYISGEVKRQMQERGRWFRVAELNPHRAKDSKIYSLQPRFESGRLHLHPNLSDELQHELRNYPRAKHDDCPDALWMACEVAYSTGQLKRDANRERKSSSFNWMVA